MKCGEVSVVKVMVRWACISLLILVAPPCQASIRVFIRNQPHSQLVPLTGAEVRVVPMDGGGSAALWTDDSGELTVPRGLIKGRSEIEIDGFRVIHPGPTIAPSQLIGYGGWRTPAIVAVPASPLHGLVVSSDEEPIEGVKVQLLPYVSPEKALIDQGVPPLQTQSDRNGRIFFSGVDLDRDWSMICHHPDWVSEQVTVNRKMIEGRSMAIIEMRPSSVVVGRALGNDGRPISGASVSLCNQSLNRCVVSTGLDGAFELSGVGGAQALLSINSHELETFFAWLDLRSEKRRDLGDILLTSPTLKIVPERAEWGWISARVDTVALRAVVFRLYLRNTFPSGQIEETCVCGGRPVHYEWTTNHGILEPVRVPAGKYYLSASTDQESSPFVDVDIIQGETIGSTLHPKRVRTINGRVRSETGVPVAMAKIVLFDDHDREIRSVRADLFGEFSTEVPEVGRLKVAAWHPDYRDEAAAEFLQSKAALDIVELSLGRSD